MDVLPNLIASAIFTPSRKQITARRIQSHVRNEFSGIVCLANRLRKPIRIAENNFSGDPDGRLTGFVHADFDLSRFSIARKRYDQQQYESD